MRRAGLLLLSVAGPGLGRAGAVSGIVGTALGAVLCLAGGAPAGGDDSGSGDGWSDDGGAGGGDGA